MRERRLLRASLLATALVAGVAAVCAATALGAAPRSQRPHLGIRTLQQISMVTPTFGYGLFTDWGAGTCEVVVGTTHDAARTFRSQVVVERWHCGNSGMGTQAITTDGARVVFVWGRGLWASHDAGATWTAVPHAGYVLGVATAEAPFGRPPPPRTQLWLVTSLCPPHRSTSSASACPLRIEASADQGWTWSLLKAQPLGARSWADRAPALGTSPLVRVSTEVSYVVSTTASFDSRSEPMWVTTDGGAAWHERFVRCARPMQSVVLAADPNGTLVSVCGYEESAGWQGKSVSTSANQGATWHVYGACGPPPAVNRDVDAICEGYLGQVVAPVRGSVFETGCRSSVNVSRDGGIRWATIRPLMGNLAGCSAQIDFVNQSVGFVLGAANTGRAPSAIWVTTDGGRKWAMELPSVVSATSRALPTASG